MKEVKTKSSKKLCRDAKGRFVSCSKFNNQKTWRRNMTKSSKRLCRDAKGRFIRCSEESKETDKSKVEKDYNTNENFAENTNFYNLIQMTENLSKLSKDLLEVANNILNDTNDIFKKYENNETEEYDYEDEEDYEDDNEDAEDKKEKTKEYVITFYNNIIDEMEKLGNVMSKFFENI